jgi:hypothetical protein
MASLLQEAQRDNGENNKRQLPLPQHVIVSDNLTSMPLVRCRKSGSAHHVFSTRTIHKWKIRLLRLHIAQ